MKQKFIYYNNIPCLFLGKHAEVFFLVSGKLHIGKYMDNGHCFCDVLYYNSGTWSNFDDCTMNNYSVSLENIYDSLYNKN